MKWCRQQNARGRKRSWNAGYSVFCHLLYLYPTFALTQSADAAPAAPPTSRQGDVRETLHGVTVADPYRWLEDQQSAETRAWITQQNEYTHKLLD
jgi:hypothetical protein